MRESLLNNSTASERLSQQIWKLRSSHEQLALSNLLTSGHQVLLCNYKTPYAEIDFLTWKAGVFFLIEVKSSLHVELNPKILTFNQLRRLKKAVSYLVANKVHPLEFFVLIVESKDKSIWLPIDW